MFIFEDDEDIRQVLKETLEDEGYRVETAANGREGMEALVRLGPPCVILLDLMMPVMSGWEVLDALRERQDLAAIPVVVVSASGDKAQHTRVARIMRKPVSVSSLLATVEQYCQHGRHEESAHPLTAAKGSGENA